MSVSEYQHQTISSFFQGSFKTSVKMAVLLMTSLVLSPSQAQEVDNVNNLPSATTTWYGTMPDSTPVYKVTLKNSNGVEADVISYGGTITRLVTPDNSGQSGNIVLGFDKLEDYLSAGYYFGAIIGRYGNRIADGKFTLNGTEYQLATNDGDNHLHGGVQGFDKKVWQMAPFATANSAGVVLTLISPDGDQGYPGKLDTQVTYTLTNSNTLDMAFTATTDKPTIVNLTQHSYFNLQGKGDILDHQLQINGDRYTPVDGGLIPTGEVASVKGTPFDFTQPKAIGKDINVKDKQLALGQGFDHNFVIKDAPGDELIEAANVYEPQTGRTLKVYTVEPAVQFYSGNFLDGSTQQEGMTHTLRSGFCLEPQHNPDSPNQPDFASTVLNPGEVYSTRIVYEFSTKQKGMSDSMKSMKLRTLAASLLVAFGMTACSSTPATPTGETADKSDIRKSGTFTNPLFPNGADPWLEYWDGNYYLTTTTWTSELVMRKSPTLAGLADAKPVNVWSATESDRCCNFWAFEFHRLKGPDGYRWYMMYTAGRDGTLDFQHLNVLESAGDDPMGPYQYKGALMPDVWNIDGNYLEYKGKLYVIYSQWRGDQQMNIIAEMENPWTLKADQPHTVLTRPELDWEISGRKVTEGAEILQHDGRTFMTYSASFCNTPDYKLGMLELVGDDPMDAAAWKKFDDPVFVRTDKVFGPGHNGFFTSPDGGEDWLVYHGNDSVKHGCSATRSLRAQKFEWQQDGLPDFGEPLTPGVVVPPPSGENGPLVTRVQGQRYQLVNATSDLCLDISSDPQDNRAVQRQCAATNGQWILDATSDGFVRLANREDSKFLEVANCSTSENARVQSAAWRNNFCQEFKVESGIDGNVTLTNRYSGKPLTVAGCSASENQAVLQQNEDSACSQWQLRPTGDVVILSEQSGKALSVHKDALSKGANVEQRGFNKTPAQFWQFVPTDTGYVSLKTAGNDALCIGTENNAVVPGANLSMVSCGEPTAQWRISPADGGGVMLFNRYTKQAMGVSDCGLAEGTNIAQQPDLGTKCQVFHLREPQ